MVPTINNVFSDEQRRMTILFAADIGGTKNELALFNGTGSGAKLTNLPWQVDCSLPESRFGFHQLMLLNDLTAPCSAVDDLRYEELPLILDGAICRKDSCFPCPEKIRDPLRRGTLRLSNIAGLQCR